MTQHSEADEPSDKPARVEVLIVEDEPSARDAIQRYLRHCGYSVQTAASAGEAFALAADRAPRVAVCDWRLGGETTGVEVARRLQSCYRARVIFVTAHPVEELRDVTEDIEVERYLRKPVSLTTLTDAIAAAAR